MLDTLLLHLTVFTYLYLKILLHLHLFVYMRVHVVFKKNDCKCVLRFMLQIPILVHLSYFQAFVTVSNATVNKKYTLVIQKSQ